MFSYKLNPVIKQLYSTENQDFASLSDIFLSNLARGFLTKRINRIDGHGHSQYSDGIFSLTDLADFVLRTKSASIILTDHNTVIHYHKLLNLFDEYKEDPIIIPGTEFTSHINATRCHCVWIGGKMDSEFINFIEKQRELYVYRESEKLKSICFKYKITYNLKDYLSFCNSKTPNWTITYHYLQKLGFSSIDARQLLREARDIENQTNWWQKIPSLTDLYTLAQQQNALLFLCHIGDIAKSIDFASIQTELKKLPNLLLDLSERPEHSPNQPAINSIPEALERTIDRPTLVGTDYHNVLPNPQNTNPVLRAALLKLIIKSDSFPTISSSSLIPHHGLFINLIGQDKLFEHEDVFRKMNSDPISEWIESYLYRKQSSEKTFIVESIISLNTLKNLHSPLLLKSILKGCDTNSAGSFISDKLINQIKKFKLSKKSFKTDLASILSLGDVCLRMGQYPIFSKLLNDGIGKYPSNFFKGYLGSLSLPDSQAIIEKLWLFFNKTNAPHLQGKLIWRLKTPTSALNTVTKNFIQPDNSRHGLLKDNCLTNATFLLNTKPINETVCREAYKNLIYDHLAATLIIPDSEYSYEEILKNIVLPIGWQIISSEYIPRKNYHHRLWLLIKCPIGKDDYTFELMIKKETDFYIGRAYQWYEKNCTLALSTSPWQPNGDFDRNNALLKWNEKKSVNSLLNSELIDWYQHAERQ